MNPVLFIWMEKEVWDRFELNDLWENKSGEMQEKKLWWSFQSCEKKENR